MNEDPQHAVDPEAAESYATVLRYEPRCPASVQRVARRLQRELGLDYTPVVASPPQERRRVRVRRFWTRLVA